nr:hypothetical protein [Pseudoroseomonas rhizosphaerae]
MGLFVCGIGRNEAGESAFRHDPLRRSTGVSVHLLQGAMPRHGHDLVRRAAQLGQARGSRLAQPMGRAERQAGLPAPLAEAVAERLRRVGRAPVTDQEGQFPGGGRIKDALKLGHDGQFKPHRTTLPILLLREGKPAVAHMLPAKLHHVAAPLAGVEQQRHGKPGLAAHRVMRLELPHLLQRPRMEALGAARQVGHLGRRVVMHQAQRHAVPVDGAQGLQEPVGGLGRLCPVIPDADQVAGLQPRRRLVAVALAEAVQDAAPHALGALIHAPELGRAVIGHAERIHTARQHHAGGHRRLGLLRLGVDRLPVLGIEGIRAGRLVQANLGLARLAQVDTDIAVPVPVLHHVAVIALHLDHGVSQGLASPSPGSAAKARSSACRSHTLRAPIRFGPGIRPSCTMPSNVVGLMPR